MTSGIESVETITERNGGLGCQKINH